LLAAISATLSIIGLTRPWSETGLRDGYSAVADDRMDEESLSRIISRIANRASELTGVDAAEIAHELEPSHSDRGWYVRFTGPSSQVGQAVSQAISELKR
jgi:hypothetical protein